MMQGKTKFIARYLLRRALARLFVKQLIARCDVLEVQRRDIGGILNL
jgi:hypothetical protein